MEATMKPLATRAYYCLLCAGYFERSFRTTCLVGTTVEVTAYLPGLWSPPTLAHRGCEVWSVRDAGGSFSKTTTLG